MVNIKPLEFDQPLRVRISLAQREGLAALRDAGETESEQIRRLIDAEIERGKH